jgi:hypothetical protein
VKKSLPEKREASESAATQREEFFFSECRAAANAMALRVRSSPSLKCHRKVRLTTTHHTPHTTHETHKQGTSIYIDLPPNAMLVGHKTSISIFRSSVCVSGSICNLHTLSPTTCPPHQQPSHLEPGPARAGCPWATRGSHGGACWHPRPPPLPPRRELVALRGGPGQGHGLPLGLGRPTLSRAYQPRGCPRGW